MNHKFLTVIFLILLSVALTGCVKSNNSDANIDYFRSQKKAVLIIAQQGFGDDEYNTIYRALEDANIEVKTASFTKEPAIGKLGSTVEIDIRLDTISIEDFDAVVFLGGPGARDYMNNTRIHEIALRARELGKVVGASGIASTILAQAGVLRDRKATTWSDPLDNSAIEILQDNGAVYVDSSVVVDDAIITSYGSTAVISFGKKIIELLNK